MRSEILEYGRNVADKRPNTEDYPPMVRQCLVDLFAAPMRSGLCSEVMRLRKEFYEDKHARKADLVMVISPMIDDRAGKAA